MIDSGSATSRVDDFVVREILRIHRASTPLHKVLNRNEVCEQLKRRIEQAVRNMSSKPGVAGSSPAGRAVAQRAKAARAQPRRANYFKSLRRLRDAVG